MKNLKIIEVKSKDILDDLYNNSAFTYEGFAIDEENLMSFRDALIEEKLLNQNEILNLYLIKGSFMNRIYGLKGDNAYHSALNIISIKLDNFQCDIEYLAMKRFYLGARWFDDIVDNNIRRNISY